MSSDSRCEAARAAVLSALEQRGWLKGQVTSDELGSVVSISRDDQTGLVRLLCGSRDLGLARIDVGEVAGAPLASAVWRRSEPDLWDQGMDESEPPHIAFQGALGEEWVSIAVGTIGAENHEGELWRRAAKQLAAQLDELRPGVETRWGHLAALEGAAAPARRESGTKDLVSFAAKALFFGGIGVLAYLSGKTAGIVIGSVVCALATVGFVAGLWIRRRDKRRALRQLGSCVEGLQAGGFDRIVALAHTGRPEHVCIVLDDGSNGLRPWTALLERMYFRARSSRHPLVASVVLSRVEWKEALEPCKIAPELWVTTRIEGPAEWLARLPRRRAEHRTKEAVVWIDGPQELESRALRRCFRDFAGAPAGAPYR